MYVRAVGADERNDKLIETITDCLTTKYDPTVYLSPSTKDQSVTDGLFAIASAIENLATQIKEHS